MQITQKKSRKKIIIPIVLIAAALIAGGIFWYQSARQSAPDSSQSKTDTEGSSPDASKLDKDQSQQQSAEQQKQDIVKDDQNKPTEPGDLTVTLTAKGRNGDIYQLRYLIQQTVSEGMCELTLTKGSSTITKTAPVQAQSSSSTCQGFDIKMSELGSGTWQTNLKVTSGSQSGTSSNEISI